MSVKRYVKLVCDITGLESELLEGSSAEAKATLRQRGWRFRGGVHRSPEAIADEARRQPAPEQAGE